MLTKACTGCPEGGPLFAVSQPSRGGVSSLLVGVKAHRSVSELPYKVVILKHCWGREPPGIALLELSTGECVLWYNNLSLLCMLTKDTVVSIALCPASTVGMQAVSAGVS